MLRSILIVERHREVAEALEQVIASAEHAAIVRSHVDSLDDINPPPAVIVLRITLENGSERTHASLAKLPADRPPIVAIVREDEEATEAARLKCDVVLRAPQDLGRLREVLLKLAR
jgi:DNA-binding response OmpR family regulator